MNVKKYMKIISLALAFCLVLWGGFAVAVYVIHRETDTSEEELGLSKVKGKRVNVLLMATDEGGQRTDTIMIASFDREREQLNILSIPRDTKVTINNSAQKINAAYAIGKHELAIKTVRDMVGLPIHYYAVVNPDGFAAIIDILGGVDIDVPQRMKYDDPVQDLHIDLYPGMQHLDGDKAEQFCRFRSYPEGDIGRVKAQQMFIKALIEQKLNLDLIFKAKDIFAEVEKYLTTNISLGDIGTFIPLMKLVSAEKTNTYQLPGEPKYINNISYYICDREETDKLVNEVFLNIVPEASGSPSGSPAPTTGKK